MVNAEKFRNIFLSYLNNKTSKKDYFIFLPDEKLLESTAETPNNFLETLKEKLKKTPPSYLYKLGHKSQTKSFDVNDLLKTLQHRPITFVIFPGFMSEFIETKTLQEVFHENLEFCNDFYQSEFKNKNNNILIKYLLFKTPPMSFATIGDTRENAMDFIERLERFFSVNGVPENMVFLGYSRGTMIALDVLALLMQRKSPWLKNIKGMVSLGGVVFGSDLVDEVFRSPTDREILLLKELGNKLKIPKNLETLSVSNTPLKKI
ncbi:MAG: hypothetical protein HY072_04915 [Deltaproteobacteria bacterium]|nr:hypothetical protein [Deltaproteobacteria bacterium]